jgi:2'-hydroxyisoflavone reductase
MARVLVIGGTAFIGRAMVEQLLKRGDDVVIMHRSGGTRFGDRVSEIRCDRNDVDEVRKVLRDEPFDLVFDNVYDWQRGTTPEQVTASALAVADGLGRYVFTSSIAVYVAGLDFDEHSRLAPPDHPDDYARNKAGSERALFALHAGQDLPVTTLRPAFVYGPHNMFDREAFFWDRIVRDRPVLIPGDGDRPMQWASAEDVARVAIAASGNVGSNGEAYNVASPPVTQVEFVDMLARAAGREVRLFHIPRERILEAGGGLMAPPLYFGAYLDLPPLTVRTDRVGTELGITLTPLDQGLSETFAWYERQPRPEPDFSWEDGLLASTG